MPSALPIKLSISPKLFFEVELGCEVAGAVAEVVDALKAALGDQRVDPVFEFAAGESAGDACAAAAGQDGV